MFAQDLMTFARSAYFFFKALPLSVATECSIKSLSNVPFSGLVIFNTIRRCSVLPAAEVWPAGSSGRLDAEGGGDDWVGSAGGVTDAPA